ncbi:hypothetical protein FBUS_01074 [Fasciolopsis buskii]|uniref:Uncharacterized protein n=1 Tax=Fasciolopsis buskii TaxID=27845 RepID=A0A8E0RWS3_9TREM|nr:hypothetical protein FBUS_01074 [Fasciolopsis buski]
MTLCIFLHAKHLNELAEERATRKVSQISAEDQHHTSRSFLNPIPCSQRSRIDVANCIIIGMQIATMCGKSDLFGQLANLLNAHLQPMIKENVSSPELAQVTLISSVNNTSL